MFKSLKTKTISKKINKLSPLTLKEERQLWEKIGEGDTKAKERIIKTNLKLVVSIAQKI